MASVFLTGGTGYIGSRLIPELVKRGHSVRALVRTGSAHKLPQGCELITADPLDVNTFTDKVGGCDTFVQLVGVAHPSPSKADEFIKVDLASAKASVDAAARNGIRHFIYVSVAQPAPAMKSYVAVRATCEEMIKEHRLNATILRPWYVLGPGHRWPYLLIPFYWLAAQLPPTRAGAERLGLVRIDDMIKTLINAVEHPVTGIVIAEVPQIRKHKVRPAMMAAKVRD
jgi:uncharacterized protein YbjT (DUF2867 family)